MLISNAGKDELEVKQLEVFQLSKYGSSLGEAEEEKYRNLVEFAPDAILIYYGETVVYVNKAGAKLLGTESTKDIIGKSLKHFVHPSYQGIVAKRIWQAMNGNYVPNLEEKFIRINGEVIDVEVATVPIVFQGKSSCQVSARDITKRKQLEQELRYRIEFESLITSISTSFINLTPDEVENEVNSALKRIGNYIGIEHVFAVCFVPDSMKIDKIYKWLPDGYQSQLEPYIGRKLESIFPWFAQRIKCMDLINIPENCPRPPMGSSEIVYAQKLKINSFVAKPMVYGKTLVGFLGFHTEKTENKISSADTTALLKIVGEIIANALEHKRAAEKLRMSEQRFYKAFNFSSSLVAIIKAKDERYLEVNEGFIDVTGYQREEVIDKSLGELNILVDIDQVKMIKQLLIEQGKITNMEFLFRTKSGEERIGLGSCAKIVLNNELCVMTSFIDITEHKRLEREMSRLERLNLIGEMAAGIGHEIRNPLTTVRGFLQVLSSKKDCLQYKDYFDLMIDELDRANSIISEFLSLTKNKPVVYESKNLNVIVNALFPLIMADAMTLNKQVQTELGSIPNLCVDEKEIRQLLLNLVRNGLEAMGPGGILEIKTYQEGEEVVLVVQDQGTGIQPELLEKLGSPFLTTKPNGTGIGLAVCYSIVSRHKGVIDVQTGPEGTSFFVRFKAN